VAVQRLSNSGRSGFSYKSLIAGITPLPSVPAIGAATAVNFSSVNVAFTAPGAYAGSTYTATSSPGGLTGTSASSPILVTGLSESTAYTFTVTATNATGTSGASAASDAVTTPSGDTGVMFPIQMLSVGAAGASTISFTSIPNTYKHLQIRAFAKTNRATYGTDSYYMRFNSDTGANYAYHWIRGNGATATASASTGTNEIYIESASGTNVSSSYGAAVIDILDYTSTSKFKTTRTLSGVDINGTISSYGGFVYFQSGLWRSTSALTSIQIISDDADAFQQYSSFALYGIEGA